MSLSCVLGAISEEEFYVGFSSPSNWVEKRRNLQKKKQRYIFNFCVLMSCLDPYSFESSRSKLFVVCVVVPVSFFH